MTQIQILMGVCDGASFLPPQLNSIRDQDHPGWNLLASDDSKDSASRAALEAFQNTVPQKVQVIDGPQKGFAANFRHLIANASPGMVALADQDDIWLPDKLSRACAALSKSNTDTPVLYCARVQPWSETDAKAQRPQPVIARAPGFHNALIENIAHGNTIVLNPAAAELARSLAQKTPDFFAHDWWLYQVITGAGGTIVYDPGPPVVLYRQHDANVIGSGRGLRGQFKRKRAVLHGAFAERLTLNAKGLHAARAHLTPKNAELFDAFEHARALPLAARLKALYSLGLYRQKKVGTLGFFGAAALGLV